MNKTIGIIVAIVVIAGGAFLLMNKKSDDTATKGSSESAKMEDSEQSNLSLKSLMSSGKSQKCTFSMNENDSTGTGTFYIANGKSRGDITATVSGKSTTTHMISDGTTSYVWFDGSSTGFKTAINGDDLKAAQSQTQTVDPNKNYDFKCSGWSSDSSMFVTPSNVEFKEFNMPVIPAASDSSSTSAGANTMMNADTVCAGLTGSAKEQCVAAMQKR